MEDLFELRKKMTGKAIDTCKKAKSGKDYGDDLCETLLIGIRINTGSCNKAQEVPNTRIFENIFE